MYIIAPMSNVGSPEKRDRFLECLHAVADVTIAAEPDAVAYAWFRSAENTDSVPHHWVRGLEVYANLEASTQTHRASMPYKAFRAACTSQKLLDRPSDLRYLEPLGIGFMARDEAPVLLQGQTTSGYVVFEYLRPKETTRPQLLEQLGKLARVASDSGPEVQSFWALGYRAEDSDETLVLFQRYSSEDAYKEVFMTVPQVVTAK